MPSSTHLAAALAFLPLVAFAAQPSTPPPRAEPSPIMADDQDSGKALHAEEPAIKERIKRIDEELKAMDRAALKDSDWAKEWAGLYYEGDGLGTNVSIHLAPKAGIGYLNYGCLGLYGGDHGDIVGTYPDGLKLNLVLGKKHGSYLTERIYFVKWGEERFLVPDWALMRMVNNYNEGGFARSSMFGIPRKEREGQSLRGPRDAPAGRPNLPAAFAALLRDAPVTLKVTNVSPMKSSRVTDGVSGHRCTIEFDGGAERGVYVGMEFWYPPEIGADTGRITITRVDAKTCTGELQAFLGEKEKLKGPDIGQTVTAGGDRVIKLPKPSVGDSPTQPVPPRP